MQKLKNGEIAGIIHVGGAPIPLLADVNGDSGIHFLPVSLNPTLAQTYLPDQFTHATYPALVPADAPVPTIAVGDVLAVFAWQKHTERYDNVNATSWTCSSASSTSSSNRRAIPNGAR